MNTGNIGQYPRPTINAGFKPRYKTMANPPLNHKTVFILDRVPYLSIEPTRSKKKSLHGAKNFVGPTSNGGISLVVSPIGSKDTSSLPVNLVNPIGSKSIQTPSGQPVPPADSSNRIVKALWSILVEACTHYNQIAKDIFSDQKLFRFVINENLRNVRVVNTWSSYQQDTNRVLRMLLKYKDQGQLNMNNIGNSLRASFRAAIEAGSQYSKLQFSALFRNDASVPVSNRFRVFCIVYANNDEQLAEQELIFRRELELANENANKCNSKFQVDHCHLIIVNICLKNTISAVHGHDRIEVSSILSTEVISIPSYDYIGPKFLQLVLQHFQLRSTTITLLPMELDGGPLSNNSVEIFHPENVHNDLFKLGIIDPNNITLIRKDKFHKTCIFQFVSADSADTPEANVRFEYNRISVMDKDSPSSFVFQLYLKNGGAIKVGLPNSSGVPILTYVLLSKAKKLCLRFVSMKIVHLTANPSSSKVGKRSNRNDQNECTHLVGSNVLKRQCTEQPNTFIDSDGGEIFLTLKKNTPDNILHKVEQYTKPLLSLVKKPNLSREDTLRCRICIYNLAIMFRKEEQDQNTQNLEKICQTFSTCETIIKTIAAMKLYITVNHSRADHWAIIKFLEECWRKPEPLLAVEKNEVETTLRDIEHDIYQMMNRETVIRDPLGMPVQIPFL